LRSIPAGLAAHLQGAVTTLAVCWRVERRDGVLILGTEHDQDLTVDGGSPTAPLAGTYLAHSGITGSSLRSGSDLSVDNMEVSGAIVEELFSALDLSAADIEAGLYDRAVVTLFACNWQAPDDGQVVLRHGWLGNVRRTTDGHYTAELRGLSQALSQTIIRTFSETCDADLGDSRCGVDIAALTVNASASAVTSRRVFECALSGLGSPEPLAGYFVGGRLEGLTGANAGYWREVKIDAVGGSLGNLELWEAMPLDVEIGDTFSLTPGCDKARETCRDKFDNVLRFRGMGVFTPTANDMIAGPERGEGPV
jgi:uncharacterized phage protein (TIGR02218 family)